MTSWRIATVRIRSFSLVLFFAFCQIVGTMCTVPDLPMADDAGRLAEQMGHMACPMDGTIMCPPSAVSSPERKLQHAASMDLNQTLVPRSPVMASTDFPIFEYVSWDSASVFVPISIASPSVLRI
ncbi:MAG: hypothetical protein QM706_13795 [Nitrospira sp.]